MKISRALLFGLFLSLPIFGVVAIVAQNEMGGTYTRNERLPIAYDLNNLMQGQSLLFRYAGPSAPDSEIHLLNLPDVTPADFIRALSDKPHQMELDVGEDVTSEKVTGNLYIDGMPYHDFVVTPASVREGRVTPEELLEAIRK